MTREVWQEYDCPVQQADADLFDDQMVYKGQSFHCHWCGGEHVAGVDVWVETFESFQDSTVHPELPESAEALAKLREGAE